MKIITLITAILISTGAIIAQDVKKPTEKLPPIKVLPKIGEMKQFFELPSKMEYRMYNHLGGLVKLGNAEFIDVTKLEKGTYFIHYNGKKERYLKK